MHLHEIGSWKHSEEAMRQSRKDIDFRRDSVLLSQNLLVD